jgi:DUF1680 family protein
MDENPEFATEFKAGLLNGTQIVTTQARQAARNLDGSVSLGNYEGIVLIPYHLWNNRGKGEMKVWIPFNKSVLSN